MPGTSIENRNGCMSRFACHSERRAGPPHKAGCSFSTAHAARSAWRGALRSRAQNAPSNVALVATASERTARRMEEALKAPSGPANEVAGSWEREPATECGDRRAEPPGQARAAQHAGAADRAGSLASSTARARQHIGQPLGGRAQRRESTRHRRRSTR